MPGDRGSDVRVDSLQLWAHKNYLPSAVCGFFAISVATFTAGIGDGQDGLVQIVEEMDLLQNVHPSGA